MNKHRARHPSKLVILGFLLFNLITFKGMAAEDNSEGIYNTVSIGPSILTLQKGEIYFSKFAGSIFGESGYRFNRMFALALGISLDLGSVDGGFFGISTFGLSPTIYPLKNWSITPGGGLALLVAENYIDDVFIAPGLEIGMAASLTSGYKFNVGRSFKLGPVGRLAFNRAAGANAWVYGLAFNMTFSK